MTGKLAEGTPVGTLFWLVWTLTFVIGFMTSASVEAATAADPRGPNWFDRAQCSQVHAPKEPRFEKILRNFESNKTLEIDGPDWNNTLIMGCKISDVDGDGIRIRNVQNLSIRNCQINNVKGSGILLRSTGSTNNVSILNNQIKNTGKDGIAASQRKADGIDHLGLVIGWNTITNTGQRGRKGLQHSIYSQASDAVIVHNVIQSERDGNAISIRSSGFVACNSISGRSRSGKPGIRYFADHYSGQSQKLVIRNNSIRGSNTGIHLLTPPKENKKKPAALVRNFEISGNESTSSSVVEIDQFWLQAPFATIDQSNNIKIK